MTVGVLVSAGQLALPAGDPVTVSVYNAVGLASFAAILVGIRRHRPQHARAWYLIAGGVGGFVAADFTFQISGLVLGEHPYPYWDDAIYFVAYPVLLAGLLKAARGGGRKDRAGMIDAAVIASAAGLVFWIFVIEPTLGDTDMSLRVRLVTVGSPTYDVLLCAVLTRMLSRAGARTPSLVLLAVGCAVTFGGDVAWSITRSFGTYSGGLIGAGFTLAYVCWGGAALHPSMREPAALRDGRRRLGRGRLALLAGCTLLVPAVLFIEGARGDAIDWAAIGVGAVVLFLLVVARLGGFVGQVQSQAALLEDLAMHDELTGLANRRRFAAELTGAVAAGSPQVCLLDLDGFKQVNDRYGHGVGDGLLIAVAERLRGELRDADLVARMGGDEFAVLLTDAGPADGDAVVDRLAAALRRPFPVDGHDLLVCGAIGIADATGGAGPVEVLRRADVAMYAAKAGGGRRRYAAELDARAGEEARLGADLRTALDGGQFHLVYQPIVALPGGELRYVEALVRWQHPVRGFVSPGEFVPVAERNGLIVELGEWILRTACARFVAWRAEHGPTAPQRISVNVSARQLAEPDFAQVVADTLAATRMAAGDLIVEVTETAVFGGGDAVRAVEDLHRLGVRVALDDFGTGHSSLGLLQTVPVDVLKVDKSFVDHVVRAGRHAVLATALIQVSDGLGLTAVAEGVETAEQAAELHRLGYRLAQGYHFGRPVPEPDFRGSAAVAR